MASSHQIKQTLPSLYNDEVDDNFQEKRNHKDEKQSNYINRWQRSSQKEQIQINEKNMENLLPINQNHKNSLNQIKNCLTNTPHRHDEHVRDYNNNRRALIANNFYPRETNNKIKHEKSNNTILKGKNLSNINRRKQSTEPTYSSKPVGFVMQNKNRTTHRNTIPPFKTSPSKVIRIPNIDYQAEQNQEFNSRQNSLTESMNNSLRTSQIQSMNINHILQDNEANRFNNASKINTIEFNKVQENSNRIFEARSPTSWSIVSDHQINQQRQNDLYESSPSFFSSYELSDDKLTHTYGSIITNEQRPLHERYVLPDDKSQHLSFIDHSSKISSCQTYSFAPTSDSDNIINSVVNSSSHELIESDDIVDQQSSSFSSLDRLSPNDRLSLPLEKVTMSMEKDDISINYDSDDGWSNDSAELIYVDDRYTTQNKRIDVSHSPHPISKQHSLPQTQQKTMFLP
ncbi:unnamed protein product [Rotaria sp. Silwood1]|nr:unnamed protein product [Rotaria sp. Silwood1]